MPWLIPGIFVIFCIALIVMVFQGLIYVGWAVGGIVGILLAVLLGMAIIKEAGFWSGIIGIIVLCLLFQWLF